MLACLSAFMCTPEDLEVRGLWNLSKIGESHRVDAEDRICVLSKSSDCL